MRKGFRAFNEAPSCWDVAGTVLSMVLGTALGRAKAAKLRGVLGACRGRAAGVVGRGGVLRSCWGVLRCGAGVLGMGRAWRGGGMGVAGEVRRGWRGGRAARHGGRRGAVRLAW